jgi:hypothetical protein
VDRPIAVLVEHAQRDAGNFPRGVDCAQVNLIVAGDYPQLPAGHARHSMIATHVGVGGDAFAIGCDNDRAGHVLRRGKVLRERSLCKSRSIQKFDRAVTERTDRRSHSNRRSRRASVSCAI